MIKPKYFAITNHTDHSLVEMDWHPSEGADHGFVAPLHKTKREHRAWSAKPTTEHRFFSLAEPVNKGRRCSLDNPPDKLYGFIADYDAPFTWDKLSETMEKVLGGDAPRPTWATVTWSGFLRLVWEFDTPIRVPEGGANDFLKGLSERLQAKKLGSGFDKSCMEAQRYYELGTDWKNIGGVVPNELVLGVLFKNHRPAATTDLTIPFEDVAKEVASRFGNRLSGDFEVGARVPLFWIDDGIDRIGAEVKEEGVLAYSDRAEYVWNDWSTILGSTWVKQYEDRKVASSVDNVYTDGKNYWTVEDNRIYDETKDNFLLRLRHMGFKPERKKGQALSELDRVLLFINTNKRVDGVGPFVFRGDVVVETDGRRVLNTSRNRPVLPAGNGDPSDWPWLKSFLSTLFDNTKVTKDTNQLDVFLSWLQRFYIASVDKKKLSGHCLVMSGPTGRGKTLLSKQIVGQLVGGSEEASTFLTGQTQFNKKLIESALWTIDDTASASDWKQNRKLTDLIKRSVANPFVESRAMYRDAMEVEWNGRLMISLNEDASSLSIVPQQDSSNRDKVLGLRISENAPQKFPDNNTLETIIHNELPHFGKWLRDVYKIPDSLKGNSRYGIEAWFHPHLRDAARDNSPSQATMELVDLFAKLHRDGVTSPIWQGTVTELLGAMGLHTELRSRGGQLEQQRLSRDLRQAAENCLDNKDIRPVVAMPTGGGTIWIINLSKEFDLVADAQ